MCVRRNVVFLCTIICKSNIEHMYNLFYSGKIYDLGGQVLAENSAPTIFHLAKEIGAKTEQLDGHKFATIDSSTGKYNDSKVVDDYVSVISLTLKIEVCFVYVDFWHQLSLF